MCLGSLPDRFDSEAIRDLCRAIEYLQQRIANRAAVFTPLPATAEKLDPTKASAAFRTGDIVLFHASIMLHGNPLANPTAWGVSRRCHMGVASSRNPDLSRTLLTGGGGPCAE